MKLKGIFILCVPAIFLVVGVTLIIQKPTTRDITALPKGTVVQWISIPAQQDTDMGYLVEGKNWNQIYWREDFFDTLVENADSSTFQIASGTPFFVSRYGKDAQHVFYASGTKVTEIPNADTSTFTLIYAPGYDAQDKNHKYLLGKIVF